MSSNNIDSLLLSSSLSMSSSSSSSVMCCRCWTCSKCTYVHEPPKENEYLVCAMCGGERNTIISSTGTIFTCTCATEAAASRIRCHHHPILQVSNSASSLSKKNDTTTATTTKKQQKKHHLHGSNNNFFHRRIKEKNQSSSEGVKGSMTTTTTTTVEEPKREKQKIITATASNLSPHYDETKSDKHTTKHNLCGTFDIMKKTSTTTAAEKSRTSKRHLMDVLKPQPSLSFVPYGARIRIQRRSSSSSTSSSSCSFNINIKDINKLRNFCPMKVVYNVLPKQLAACLLDQLECTSQTWNRGNWIVHGKEHSMPRMTATFYLNEEDNNNNGNSNNNNNNNGNNFVDNGIMRRSDDGEYHDEHKSKRVVSKEMLEAAEVFTTVVRRCRRQSSLSSAACSNSNRNSNSNSSTTTDWKPDFILCNRYEDGNECIGWHLDQITDLGIRPIIVGLSLGACRPFEMRKNINIDGGNKQHNDNGVRVATAANAAGGTTASSSTTTTQVGVYLPHNSIVIMWNDAQESWQHCVPRCSTTTLNHPKVGSTRILLTFRMKRRLPSRIAMIKCHCGKPAGLKCKDGKYFLFCEPYGKNKHKTCHFWKSCIWANEEAKKINERRRKRRRTSRLHK